MFALLAVCGCGNSVNTQTPSEAMAITLVPSSGEGQSGEFTVNLSPADKLSLLGVLYSARVDGGNACYVFYDPAKNSFSLVKDSGSGADPLIQGEPVVENNQCALANTGNTMANVTNNTLKLHLLIKFKPQFAGPKNAYVYVVSKDGREPGFQQEGTWLVAP